MPYRLPRPRLTVRRLMIAVALVAVGIGVARLNRLSLQYDREANWYSETIVNLEENVAELRKDLNNLEHGTQRGPRSSEVKARDSRSPEAKARDYRSYQRHLMWGIARLDRLSVYCRFMRDRYRRAASRPWILLPPDPPEPAVPPEPD